MTTVIVTPGGNVLTPVYVPRNVVTVTSGNVATGGGVTSVVRAPAIAPLADTQVVPRTIATVMVGPQGAPGAPGDSTFTATAATNLTYPCVVPVVNGAVHYADPANHTDMASQLAVTTQAAAAGATVVCATRFTLTEAAWAWPAGRVYLSDTPGQLSSTPAAAAVLEVARVLSPTTLDFDIQTALLRA